MMFSDSESDHDWSDNEGYYDEIEDAESSGVHPLLEADMEQLKSLYGHSALSHRLFLQVDSIDVELTIMTGVLERDVALAWKIKPDEPIIVRLHLSTSHYLDAEMPKVEVFQPSQKEKFGIGSQLRKILENFLMEQWRNLSNVELEKQTKKSKLFKQQKSNETVKLDDPLALSSITAMGFSEEMARNALVMSRGNREQAINLLIANPDCCTSAVVPEVSVKTKTKKDKHSKQDKSPGGATKDAGKGGIFRGFSPVTDSVSEHMRLTKTVKDAKQVPSLEQGFLVMIMNYVYQRLPTLNEFCVVCDECHVFQNGGMLKPAVCARGLCTFAFMSLGVMSDAADDIATGADVVDLLIAMANAACKSPRRADIFDPFPTVVNPLNPKELALSPEKKEFLLVANVMNNFIRMSEMTQIEGVNLKKELDKRHILCYPLLQWIISSNRSHIVKLPEDKQLDFMGTHHQFLMLNSPPAKEAAFREGKSKYGSTFAFHGSNLENWHGIVRQGLVNASGTKYQLNGAAYGKGIYLSPQSAVSFNYSKMVPQQQVRGPPLPARPPNTRLPASKSPNRRRFLQSTQLACVALCEVVLSEDLKKHRNIWVMPNPDYVCTRFFFVYEDGKTGDSSIDITKTIYSEAIQQAVQYHS